MFTFCKIKDKECPNIKYGYYLRIQTVVELMDWFNATMSSNAHDYSEMIHSKVLWGDGDHPAPLNKFEEILVTYNDKLCLIYGCQNISLSKSVLYITDTILKSKIDMLSKFGVIYINAVGGFLFGESIKESGIVRRAEMLFPKDPDIKVFRWPGGKHWYARVGYTEVEVSGEIKWNTKDEAEKKAKYFKRKIRKTAVFT
ncbi:hypothetical protein KAR91_77980 [Candidatus Pacearchaeota archaeon]|nr:hypothetical protein [Candidatus Pacearchaeota archaeon]